MNKTTQGLKEAVDLMKRLFDVDCNLSEILTLRRYVAEFVENNPNLRGNFGTEAVYQLMNDYYGIDRQDLYKKIPHPKGGFICGNEKSSLVSKSSGSEEFFESFRDYFKQKRAKRYFP